MSSTAMNSTFGRFGISARLAGPEAARVRPMSHRKSKRRFIACGQAAAKVG
jgi:hypothetical protein